MSDEVIIEGEIEEAPTVIDETIKGETEQGMTVIGERFLAPDRKPLALADLTDEDVRALEAAVMSNDFGQLTTRQRMAAMFQRCAALGLDIRLNPFVWAVMNKKLVPVRTKNAGSQSRGNMRTNLLPVQQVLDHRAGVYMVMFKASNPDGRTDYDIGATSIKNLSGEAYANAIMVAWTKAKNRVTESLETTGVNLSEEEVASVNRVDAENASAARMIDPQKKKLREGGNLKNMPGAALEGADGSYVDMVGGLPRWKPSPVADPIPPLEEIGEPEEVAYTTEGGPQAPAVRAPRAAPARSQAPGEAPAGPGPSAAGQAAAVKAGPKAPPAQPKQAQPQAAAAAPSDGTRPATPEESAKIASGEKLVETVNNSSRPLSGPASVGGAPRPPVARIGGGTSAPSAPAVPGASKPPQTAPVKAGPRAAPAAPARKK
jgi:hypothetical protein